MPKCQINPPLELLWGFGPESFWLLWQKQNPVSVVVVIISRTTPGSLIEAGRSLKIKSIHSVKALWSDWTKLEVLLLWLIKEPGREDMSEEVQPGAETRGRMWSSLGVQTPSRLSCLTLHHTPPPPTTLLTNQATERWNPGLTPVLRRTA